MKEIRAFVRSSIANHVLEAFDDIEGLDFSLVDVRGMSRGLPRDLQGDGMIFVVPVDNAIRVANGERGETALPVRRGRRYQMATLPSLMCNSWPSISPVTWFSSGAAACR